jgi:deazaflavin-dependent oxidoreductase (nitroreductase family)
MTSPTMDYANAGLFRRLVRRTAATRPMTWLYTRIQQPVDEIVCRLTRGRATASSWTSGIPVVMLTTTGARSGQPRTVPVVGVPDGDGLVVIASNYGRPHHPAWYHNLRAHPRATVSTDGQTREVVARELSGQERDACFERVVRLHPGFVLYQDRASDRPIPVLVLDPPAPHERR